MTVGQLIEWLMDHADMNKKVMAINPNEEGDCSYEELTEADLVMMNKDVSYKSVYL